MSEELSNKRSLDSEDPTEIKKAKYSDYGSAKLQELKEEIRFELQREFDGRIKHLENEIENIKKHQETKKESEYSDPKQHRFGESLIKLKSGFTPSNSFLSSQEKDKTSKSASPVPDKPVFGVPSSFGSSVGFKQGKSINDQSKDSNSEESQSKKATPTPSFGSSFGANTKFGNAFKESLNKKSFLDEPSTSEKPSKENQLNTATNTQQYKQVDLAPVEEIKTGEEEEHSIFNLTVKVFELDLTNISEGWKERGLGPVHLNKSIKDPKQARLIMRSAGLLRVILNIKITPQIKFLKGLQASLTPGKFLRFNYVTKDGKPNQYLLKFGNEAFRDELIEKVEELQKEIGKNGVTIKE